MATATAATTASSIPQPLPPFSHRLSSVTSLSSHNSHLAAPSSATTSTTPASASASTSTATATTTATTTPTPTSTSAATPRSAGIPIPPAKPGARQRRRRSESVNAHLSTSTGHTAPAATTGGRRLANELRCERCGKGYKHSSCLTKHM
ncbi:Zinc finger, C2H2 [Ascosphaera apis ARSEF 7405]|uniref:Zinc finger, C2H2 n=1 Tax=Ascosphaera apis ARSEF 7405 TaxID=392613 RepID=A0A167Y994_9EURO|nr:Zinc finger, C2H2 [Ascosphaera apis ARSEF 7405]